MERRNTRQRILEAALELFSVQGYEATGVSRLAEAVGIRKASLYGHFESKQAIWDTLRDNLLAEYNSRSIFANTDWSSPEFTADKENLTVEDLIQLITGQIRLVLHNPDISRVRRMLVIEQFRNPEMAALQSRLSYGDILNYNAGLMAFLAKRGILRDEDPGLMAAQFAWPISMWIGLCDREPEREPEAMALIERHIRQFFRIYAVE